MITVQKVPVKIQKWGGRCMLEMLKKEAEPWIGRKVGWDGVRWAGGRKTWHL